MFIQMLKSKIGHARVTAAELHYEGSITIDSSIIKAAGILPGEKVHVLNVNNGSRLETYVIAGKPGSGEVCLNGPAARQGYVGDTLVIISYVICTPEEAKQHQPKVVHLDAKNRIKKA